MTLIKANFIVYVGTLSAAEKLLAECGLPLYCFIDMSSVIRSSLIVAVIKIFNF